ncbi:MAG: hypothetical protein ACQEXJ_08930 [Myxococcota bacterium]
MATQGTNGELQGRRRAQFEAMMAERLDVLKDFAERLELSEPGWIVARPEACLPALEAFMRDHEIESHDDLVWVLPRLGYFVGEILVERYGGHWFLDEADHSRFYLHPVVGEFDAFDNPAARVAPMEVAAAWLEQTPPRSLAPLLDEIDEDLRQA